MIPSQILPVHRLTKVPSLCFINRLAGVPGNLSFRETLRVRAQESDPERAHNYVRTDFHNCCWFGFAIASEYDNVYWVKGR